MSHWIYPSNTKIYDVLSALEQNKAVWPINSNIEVDDIVYFYLSGPYKKIGFIAHVKAINLQEGIVQQYTTPYLRGAKQNAPANKEFMMLDNIRSVLSNGVDQLSYGKLKQNGLNGMLMGPRKLENNRELFEYIKRHEDAV